MDEEKFEIELQEALNKKQEWFNSECLEQLLSNYRLMHSCVKNLYGALVKKSVIQPDPYRLDKRISDISVPDISPFSENDLSTELGSRFSEYETMLDFICTYLRFSVENISLLKVKKLIDLNKCFEWENLSLNNARMNTRALALAIAQTRNGAPNVIQSMLNDCCEKCSKMSVEINRILNELGAFERELYKGELRKDLFGHPEFDKAKAAESAEGEMAEIKRLYAKVEGKKPFYNDLINEIIAEDHDPDKEKKREAVIARLQIKNSSKTEMQKKAGPSSKELLMGVVLALGGCAPTLIQLHEKLVENFNLLYQKKKNFFNMLIAAIKKAFNLKEKEKIVNLLIEDQKSKMERMQKVNVTDFLAELSKKERFFSGIASKGTEFSKIESSSEDVIFGFVNKQISELQSAFIIINSLDAHFKKMVDIDFRARVKGMQIELSALRNSIINCNKKRGEYVSFKDESEQMRNLGL